MAPGEWFRWFWDLTCDFWAFFEEKNLFVEERRCAPGLFGRLKRAASKVFVWLETTLD